MLHFAHQGMSVSMKNFSNGCNRETSTLRCGRELISRSGCASYNMILCLKTHIEWQLNMSQFTYIKYGTAIAQGRHENIIFFITSHCMAITLACC